MFTQLILCVLVADFLSGLVHWFEDTYGLPDWPVVGRLVIEPNIQHHQDPTLLVRMGGLVSRNWQTAAAAAVLCAVAWLAGFFAWQLAVVATLGAFANEVHAWAHGGWHGHGGWVIRLLHDMALVQTPAHHAQHHKRPYDRRFCTLTNWLNPLLDGLRFWRALEWCIALYGVRPKRLQPERRYV